MRHLNKVCEKLWTSGGHFMLILITSVFLCYLPFIVEFGGITNNVQDVSLRLHLLKAIQSKAWQYSIVGTIGVSIPLAVDFMIDAVNRFSWNNVVKSAPLLPRFVLICSILIPNLICIFLANPLGRVEVMFTILSIRNNMVVYAISSLLWQEGGPSFQSKLLILSALFGSFAVIPICWDFLSSEEDGSYTYTYLDWVSISLLVMAFVTLTPLVLKQTTIVLKKGIKQ